MELTKIDLSVLKYYKEGKELCGFEGVHTNLCKQDYLDGDLYPTTKGFKFIEEYNSWGKVETYDNKMKVTIG